MYPMQRLAIRTLRVPPYLPRFSIQQHLNTKRILVQTRSNLSSRTFHAATGALPHKPAPHRNPDEPIYQLTFTCKKCSDRSSHTISKQGYHRGTVLITCPGCKNRHLISDHLKIFSDTRITVQDIMAKQGELVKRGTINMEGDVEFWDVDAEPVGGKADGGEAAAAKDADGSDGQQRPLG